MKRFFLFLSFMISAVSACRVSEPLKENDNPARFTGIFANREIQQQFETFTASVVRLTIFVSYQSQVFEPDSRITLSGLADGTEFNATLARLVHNESYSGTATVLAVKGNKALLLSCAHNVSFPDTIYAYDDRADLSGNRYLLGLSVKSGEVVQVSGPTGTLHAAIIGLDAVHDLALLEISAVRDIQFLKPAGLKMAKKADLHWGDRLWMAGYPSGRFMMTTGIISNPGNNDGILLTDAPFSEGYSGAPALVYDQISREFQLAGIGRSVAAHSDYVLKPEKKIHEITYNTALPYTGQVYIEVEKHPAPGVTFVVDSKSIAGFIQKNSDLLIAHGWNPGTLNGTAAEGK